MQTDTADIRANITHASDAPSTPASLRLRAGKARTAILLWLLGVPIPVILLILLIRGCM